MSKRRNLQKRAAKKLLKAAKVIVAALTPEERQKLSEQLSELEKGK